MRASVMRQFAARKSAFPFRLSLLGVPEQINIPIQLCQQLGIFSKYGVEVDYKNVPEGTGAMLQKLHSNEADLAITVTDGFIAGQAAGYGVQLVGTYVDSPLTWAIAANPHSKYDSIEDLFKDKASINVGISRLQSGSHTMSYYLAKTLGHKDSSLAGINNEKLNFKELGSFKNLRDGVTTNSIDIFLWEVFTTKPFFQSQELKYIGEVSTPWPAFSIVASSSSHLVSGDDKRASDMYRNRFIPALAEGIALFKSNTKSEEEGSEEDGRVKIAFDCVDTACEDSISMIVNQFGHQEKDAVQWLQQTEYALPSMSVDVKRMRRALHILQELRLVPKVYPVEALWEGSGASRNNAILLRKQPSNDNKAGIGLATTLKVPLTASP